MIYLIEQLFGWLLLTAGFAALAGWAFATQRAAAGERALRRDRDNLVRDLSRLASGEERTEPAPTINAADALQSRADISNGRIAELERALAQARGRSTELASQVSELQRNAERHDADAAELTRLRAAAAIPEAEVEEIPPEAPPAVPAEVEEQMALQGWRLRYFEQRVRYLEGVARTPAPSVEAPAPEASASLPLEWRAREAEARADHLAQALREASQPVAAPVEAEPEPVAEAEPFAANADVDMLLRWRLLYLERRVAHLQAAAAIVPAEEPQMMAEPVGEPLPERWKWRARYLEARVRHLETLPPVVVEAPPAAAQEVEAASAPANVQRTKPPVLPGARNGAPDDLTLIDGVSLLRQTTLYSLGVFHFDQIAAWTPANVAWIDNYLRLRGRIDEDEWVEQADDLARDGVIHGRRVVDEEDA